MSYNGPFTGAQVDSAVQNASNVGTGEYITIRAGANNPNADWLGVYRRAADENGRPTWIKNQPQPNAGDLFRVFYDSQSWRLEDDPTSTQLAVGIQGTEEDPLYPSEMQTGDEPAKTLIVTGTPDRTLRAAPVMPEAEATAGTATTPRTLTAQRLAQAIAAQASQLPGEGEVTREMLEPAVSNQLPIDGSNWVDSKEPDISVFTHIFRLLSGERVGAVRTTGEWDLPYIRSRLIKLTEAIETPGSRWEKGGGSEIAILRDSANHALLWIDAKGRVHIPHLVAPGVDVEGSETIQTLQTRVNFESDITDHRPDSRPPGSKQARERARVAVLREPGDWSQPATHPERNKFLVTFMDDDTIDAFLINPANAPASGGYFSRLYPVFASRGVPNSLAACARFLNIRDGEPDDARITAVRMLHQRAGWEICNHTVNHTYGSAFAVNSLSEAEGFADHPVAGGSESSNDTRHVHVVPEGRDYYWAGSEEWLPVSQNWHRTFLRNFGGSDFGENPAFDLRNEYGRNKIILEERGCGPVRVAVAPAGAHSFAMREYILSEHVYGINRGGGFHAPGMQGMHVGALSCWLHRFGIDVATGLETYQDMTDAVDAAKSANAWLQIGSHANRNEWINYDEAEATATSYPASWITPVRHPDEFPEDFHLPHPSTGLHRWEDWHPCPGTRLYDLWMLLGYILDEGGEIVTPMAGWDRVGNILSVGQFTHGMRSKTFDSLKYPHYAVGFNGEKAYFNLA